MLGFCESAPSVIDGQAFISDANEENPFGKYYNTCRFNITVNGMGNRSGEELRLTVEKWLKEKMKIQKPVVVAVNNPNAFNVLGWVKDDVPTIGDVLQSILYEIKIDDLVVKNLAKRIAQAKKQAERNGCKKPCIVVYAHSQGTAVAYRAFERMHSEDVNILQNVVYCGYGGQECLYDHTIKRLGLSSMSRNFTNFWDFMNWLNPRHWTHPSIDGTWKYLPFSGDFRGHGFSGYFK